MGYKKIIRSGAQIEIFTYEKELYRQGGYASNSRYRSKLSRKRSADRRNNTVQTRSERSIRKSKRDFFRLVASNLEGSKEPAFITLTSYENITLALGYRRLAQFWQRLKIYEQEATQKSSNYRYIVVPEWQPESEFLHFHALIWDLSEACTRSERNRRNLQRLYNGGYIDVGFAYDNSIKIAGYFTKYFTKAQYDKRARNQRCYTCSRNVQRPTSAGSNQLDAYYDLLIPEDYQADKVREYDTIFLGRCEYIRLNKIENAEIPIREA